MNKSILYSNQIAAFGVVLSSKRGLCNTDYFALSLVLLLIGEMFNKCCCIDCQK